MTHFFGGIKRLEHYGKSVTGTTRLTSTPLGLNKSRIYVGNLPPDIRTKDIEDLFNKYGKIASIDLKNRREPPFAFVEFEDPRDADDAVIARDGFNYEGYKLQVKFPASSVNNYKNGITSKSNNRSSALNNGSSEFLSNGSRSSLDLDTLGRSNVTNGSVGQNHQESNNVSKNFGEIGSSPNIVWSNGTDSHDSGVGHSPPFDSNNIGNFTIFLSN